MRTSLRTIPSPDTFSRQSPSVISLGHVRPGPPNINEYVDSPRAQHALSLKPQLTPLVASRVNSPGSAHRVISPPQGVVATANANSPRSLPATSSSPIVVSQQVLPKPTSLKDPVVSCPDGTRDTEGADRADITVVGTAQGDGRHGEGIICDQCQKCRCADCTEPRPLPSHWCCHNTCEVSVDKALDVCTCFCCVKGMFYHCGAEEDNECYEKPCGCLDTPHCCQRWTLISLMAVCLPCLWAYLPAKACLLGCTSCYNRCRRKGCQCHVAAVASKDTGLLSAEPSSGHSDSGFSGGPGPLERNPSKHSQTRRLLIESDSSSG